MSRSSSYFRLCLVVAALIVAAVASQSVAHAGGEDSQTFQADCSGYQPSSGTYAKNAACVVDLLNGQCIEDASIAPRGFRARVYRFNGKKWLPVSRLTRYAACAEESENGVNRKMRFRASRSGTYAVLLDAIGDGLPAYWGTVLAIGSAPDFQSFVVTVRR